MRLNLKSTKENSGSGDYQLIPVGRYNFVIDSTKEKTSSTNNQLLEVTLTLVEGDFKNRKLWANFSLVEKAQIYLVKFIEAAGLKELTEEDGVGLGEIQKALVGKYVSGFVSQKTNPRTSKTRNEVGEFTAVPDDFSIGETIEAAPAPKAVNKRKELFG